MTTASLVAQGNGRFAVEGELSFTTAPELWARSNEAFAIAGDRVIAIDLGKAGRADSAGLALLVAWTRWARERSRSIRFVNTPSQVASLASANELGELLGLQGAASVTSHAGADTARSG
ncbi:MAG: STAS domain-containing protein [Gammaproteobacteria bacterium]|nr:STAS domain-containing protein [Gammaproteobacteria bacterium]